jgi:hypothetical protein
MVIWTHALTATFAPYGCRTLPFIGKHEYARRHYLFLGDSTLAVVFKGVSSSSGREAVGRITMRHHSERRWSS